jgi:hypothetical protein
MFADRSVRKLPILASGWSSVTTVITTASIGPLWTPVRGDENFPTGGQVEVPPSTVVVLARHCSPGAGIALRATTHTAPAASMRSFSHGPPRASLDSRGGCGRRIEHGLAAGGVVRLGYSERELKRSSTDPQLHEIGFRNRDNGTVNDGLERMRPIGSGQRTMDAGCLRRRTFGCPEVATSRRRATCSTALTCGHPVPKRSVHDVALPQ